MICLENGLKDETTNEEVSNFINLHIAVLDFSGINKKNAKIWKKIYPNLHAYLQSNHNSILPKHLKKGCLSRALSSIKRCFCCCTGSNSTKIKEWDTRALQKIKNKLGYNFFKKAIDSENRPGVITLQEVSSNLENRNEKIIRLLERNNYIIFKATENADAVIALDGNRFEPKGHLAASNYKFLAVLATDKKTQEEYLFISTHIRGFKLEYPREELREDNGIMNNYHGGVGFSVESGLVEDRREISNLISQMKENRPEIKVVVQGDFNIYPEYFDKNQTPINDKIAGLNIFEKMETESQLTLHRRGVPTSCNTLDPNTANPDLKPFQKMVYRELDYAFTSNNLAGRVEVLQLDDPELQPTFDPLVLFSDHSPLWMRVNDQE